MITPVIIIRLVDCSMRSQARSTLEIGSRLLPPMPLSIDRNCPDSFTAIRPGQSAVVVQSLPNGSKTAEPPAFIRPGSGAAGSRSMDRVRDPFGLDCCILAEIIRQLDRVETRRLRLRLRRVVNHGSQLARLGAMVALLGFDAEMTALKV